MGDPERADGADVQREGPVNKSMARFGASAKYAHLSVSIDKAGVGARPGACGMSSFLSTYSQQRNEKRAGE